MITYKKVVPIILLMLFIIPTLWGLFHNGFFASDDGNWMVIRFSAFYEALRQGQFPVRFLTRLNHGYGYPVADFLYPLFMYLGVPIKVAGFSFISTIKILFAGSLILSGIFTYAWLKKLFGTVPSFIGALCYVYFPYHLYDIYTRGSMGEAVALAIVPFIFWQIVRKDVLFSSLGIGLLILSHNTLALLFMPVVIGYMLVEVWKKQYIVKTILLSLGVSCFFWLPALYDQQFTVFSRTPVSSVVEYFISSKTISLYGYITLFSLISGVILWQKTRDRQAGFFLMLILLAGVLSFSLSQIVWNIFPLGKLVQFPFRFLSLVMPGVAFLLAYEVNLIARHRRVAFIIFSFLLIFYSSLNYLYPASFQQYPDEWYSTNQDTTTVKNEYMPVWVKHVPTETPAEKAVITKGKGTVQNISANSNTISFTANLMEQCTIRVNTIYFPGWRVFVDNKEQKIFYSNEYGLMEFLLPKGNHTIRVTFGETPIRLFADMVSVLSLGVYGIWYIVYRNKRKKN